MSNQDHTGNDAPAVVPMAHTPRVAWVFGSGGPRGFVHVGVLKALAELRLVPDLIVGASVGALVGTLAAAGLGAARIEHLALDLQPWQFLRWQPVGDERFSGSALAALVEREVGHRPLQALPTPMVCVAQRLRDGVVVGFNHGSAGLAVQAAAAIEGQFGPLRVHGERYADADLRMPLPVRMARALGATQVLAVDASAHEDHAPAGTQAYRAADLRKRALTQPDAAVATVLLHPEFGYWAGISHAFREKAIAAGYRTTMAQSAALRAMHAA